jgi:xylitol oxidase
MNTYISNSQHSLKNWAGNVTFNTTKIFYPKNAKEIQELVKATDKIKVLGSGHSFTEICDSSEAIISLTELNKIISLDKENHTVTVEGGIKYGSLCSFLHENGYALHNLASLPHITIAGACATATHGSGNKNGILATNVTAIEFIDGEGEIQTLSDEKDGEIFKGAVVSLGAIGVITKMTLKLIPTFNLKQIVYQELHMSQLAENFNAIHSIGYSVSLFTNWANKNINQVWIKSIHDELKTATINIDTTITTVIVDDLYGAKVATSKVHPIAEQSTEHLTDQMGTFGPWYERMTHFKMSFDPSIGGELQAEYFLAIEYAFEAIMAVEALNEKLFPYLLITEIRTIMADDLWMSPFYKKDSIAIHFLFKPDWENVKILITLIEEKLEPYKPIPHWGKLFMMEPKTLQYRYERINDFRELLKKYDMKGKFRNNFINKYIFDENYPM